jgi:hypothetical protein
MEEAISVTQQAAKTLSIGISGHFKAASAIVKVTKHVNAADNPE